LQISNVFNVRELKKESDMQNLHIANSDKPVKYLTPNSSA